MTKKVNFKLNVSRTLFSMLIESVILLLLSTVFISAHAQTFYVDPVNGNDANLGVLSAPFKTITQAQKAVRLVNNSMNGDIYVYLKGNEYPLTSTLNFSNLDGGANNFKVIYKAYNNEKVVLSGGKKVVGWSQVPGEKYYVANVPTGTNGFPAYFRQIWVNSRRCLQARSDFINVYPKPFDNVGTTQVCDGFIVKKSAIKNYSNLSDLRIFQMGIFKHVEQLVNSINNISDSERVIMMKQPGYDDWSKNYVYNNQSQIQIVNAFEELDEPGEFYLNRTTRKLYYYPEPGENMLSAEVIVPSVEYLVKLSGVSSKKLQNLQFEGLTFEYGNWTGPINTSKEIGRSQADLYSDYTSIEGQFSMNYSQNITIKNCRFEHFASSGIYLNSNNDNITIEGNIFKDFTAAAVIIGNGTNAVLDSSVNKNILIDNNLIRNIGADFFQASGIYANFSKNLTVIHNDVADVAYFGINQRYGYSIANITSAQAASYTGNTLIQYNKVTNYGTAAKYGFGIGDEVAGIYFYGVRTSKVQYNFVQYGGKDEFLKGAFRQDQYGCRNFWDNNVADCRPASRSFSRYAGLNALADTVLFSNCYSNVLGEFLPTLYGDTSNFFYEPNAPSWSIGAQTIINNAGLEPAYQYLLNNLSDGTNIAKNAIVKSSSNYSIANSESNLIDGSVSSSWKPVTGNETTGSWIQLTFPQPIAINKLQLVPEYNNPDPQSHQLFEVWVSNDSNFNSYNILGGRDKKPFPYKLSYQDRDVIVAYNTFDLYGSDTLGYKYIRIVGRSMSWAECRVYGTYQPLLPLNYANNSSMSFTPYLPLDMPNVNESWSQKVVDTIDNARVYFGNNSKYWNIVGASNSTSIKVTGGIASSTGGTVIFKGAIYRDERICFNLKITENGASGHRISFRAPNFLNGMTQQENYTIRFQKINNSTLYNTNVQFLRYNRDGTINTFYGAGGNMGAAILRNTTIYSQLTPVLVESLPKPNGMGIIVRIGKDTILNFIDVSSRRLTNVGYVLFNSGTTSGTIDISDIHTSGIVLSPTDTTISVNQTILLKSVVLPDNATINKVTYTSNNSSVATVNSIGQVTGINVGQTYIKVVTKDGGFVDSILINVQSPLSITGIIADALYSNSSVEVNWKIIGKNNVQSFEIQKSNVDGNFTTIGFKKVENLIEEIFNFKDIDLVSGSSLYRIKLNYFDGSISYSNVVKVSIPYLQSSISISPNPLNNNNATIIFDNVSSGNYQIKIFNALGQTVYNQMISHSSPHAIYPLKINLNKIIGYKELFVVVTPEKGYGAIFQKKVLLFNK